MQLSVVDGLRLSAIPRLTPGDFKVVRQVFEMGKRTPVTTAMLLDALEAETRYMATRSADGISWPSRTSPERLRNVGLC
jgi:hypothetical protein